MSTPRGPLFQRRFFALLAICLLAVPFAPTVAGANGTPAGINSWILKATGIPANDAAYDARRGVLMVTVPSKHTSLGNMLIEMNPSTGAVGRRIYLGSDPEEIALTDDGTTAFIGLGGTNRIVRVSLATFSVTDSFSTGTESHGPAFPEDVEAVPGRNDTVVVSLQSPGFTGRHEGVRVFRNGVPLPAHTDRDASAVRIEFTDADTVVGYNDESSDHTLTTLSLDDSGVHLVAENQTAIRGWDDIEFAAGRIYGANGQVIEASSLNAVHSFTLDRSQAVEPNPEIDRVAYLDQNKTISVFETESGDFLGRRTFPAIPEYVNGLVSSGGGYAVLSDKEVLLLGPSVISGAVAAPPGPVSKLAGLMSRKMGFAATDLLFDETRNRLYATVPDGISPKANQLLALDPQTGEVLANLPMGRRPEWLAMSDDRSTLYVSVFEGGRVNRVDLNTFMVTQTFQLGSAPFVVAEDVEVMPGTTGTVAVTLANPAMARGSGHEGVAIFKEGIKLPSVAKKFVEWADQIEFAGPATIYATNTQVSGFEFHKIEVDAAGARITRTTDYLLPSYVGKMDLTDGRVYSPRGVILDPAGPELIGHLDAFNPPRLWSQDGGTAVEAVPSWTRVFTSTSNGSLEEYDLNQMRLVGTTQVPGIDFGVSALVFTGSGLALGGRELTLLVPKGSPPPPPSPGQPAVAWGYNGFGAIGAGGPADMEPATPVGLSDVTQVSAGTYHSLALKADGTVWSWGYNGVGQLGNGTVNDGRAPAKVPGLTGMVAVSAGMMHSLALKSDGTVWAWGWNPYGQLGNGLTADLRLPAQIPGLGNVTSVSAGALHSLATKSDGTAWGWGYNGLGAIGDGTTVDRRRPVQVVGPQSITEISAGGFHSLARNNRNQVWAWGWNAFGQLGDGTTKDHKLPIQIEYLALENISAGYVHSLGRSVNDLVYGWGYNGFGQLGDGTTIDRLTPKFTGTLQETISAGFFHSVMTTRGYVTPMGWNAFGQLGNGTTTDSPASMWTGRPGFVTQVSAGGLHSLGVRAP
jgi:sugar lactone lactonase YvrE